MERSEGGKGGRREGGQGMEEEKHGRDMPF